ncbi:MAG: hypothetical protein IPH04_20530 [Saprospirales bacterium]|jgi:hypothetical protein|nr:hypothetical protein [Saprospirales bacterium]MBK6905118.1 hypothetical protein [Saprospirales bacterium]MBK7335220.1 hypothetical protein [Saprospirales bacterium]
MEKSHIRFASTLLLCWGLAVGSLFAQPSKGRLQEIPPVFVIGEFEQEYEALMGNYSKSLLDVCGNDMSLAFDLWIGLIEEMEAYSKQTGFELNGIKAWFHVFFEKDGTISRIGFYLKPTSRNVDTASLVSFLAEFVAQYKFPFTSLETYSNYTSVSFPTIYNRPLPGDHNGG